MTSVGAAVVILPTYNEAENVAPLLRELLSQPGVGGVIVVDDASPDGTGALVAEIASVRPEVRLVSRSGKLGLGTAYLAGFAKAREMGADAVVTMDADFSHPPEAIPSILAALATADVVVGSRYIPGGGIRHWGMGRRLMSRTANILARGMAGLTARDCTSGYRGYTIAALARLPLETVHSDGYSFLVELLALAQRQGLRINEIPITFTDRRVGKSKISRKEIAKSIATLFRLRRGRRS